MVPEGVENQGLLCCFLPKDMICSAFKINGVKRVSSL